MSKADGIATIERPRTNDSHADSVRIPVSGMTCAACSARIQRTLEKQPGVADANVNLMMKTATVRFDPGAVSPEQLVDAIRETGYGAELASPDQSAFEEQEARDRATAEEFRELKTQGDGERHRRPARDDRLHAADEPHQASS